MNGAVPLRAIEMVALLIPSLQIAPPPLIVAVGGALNVAFILSVAVQVLFVTVHVKV